MRTTLHSEPKTLWSGAFPPHWTFDVPKLGNPVEVNEHFYTIHGIAEGMLYERNVLRTEMVRNMILNKKMAFNHIVGAVQTLELWGALRRFSLTFSWIQHGFVATPGYQDSLAFSLTWSGNVTFGNE